MVSKHFLSMLLIIFKAKMNKEFNIFNANINLVESSFY